MLKVTRPPLATSVSTPSAASGLLQDQVAGSPAVDLARVYRYYVVAVIWLVLLLRFVDLQMIAVLLEPIRAEFTLSDTQLGLLSGTAFAIFYGTLGVPIAWLADRSNRRNLLAVCLCLWSAMTLLCGLATSFAGLFLSRVGTGVGEAGGAPPAYSLICDFFPATRRSTIFAILNSSVPAGVFVGFMVGGFISTSLGWRAAFIIIGISGVIVSVLLRLTVREPARGALDGMHSNSTAPTVMETGRYLWELRSYRHLVLASSLFTLGAIGSGIWIPSFFIRTHGMPAAQVATWLAFIYGAGGIAGAVLGGMLTDRLVAVTGDRRWPAWVAAMSTVAILPFSFFVYLWSNPITALIAHTGTTFLMHAWMGPCYATVQCLSGPKRRAMAAAANLLAVNLLAVGLGPLLVGMASDFGARFAADSLRYSILTVVVVAYGWAALHFLLAARTLRRDLCVGAADTG